MLTSPLSFSQWETLPFTLLLSILSPYLLSYPIPPLLIITFLSSPF